MRHTKILRFLMFQEEVFSQILYLYCKLLFYTFHFKLFSTKTNDKFFNEILEIPLDLVILDHIKDKMTLS